MDEDGVDIPAEGAPVVFGEIELAGDGTAAGVAAGNIQISPVPRVR